jgi:putative transposase
VVAVFEPICGVLSEHGCPIVVSTNYDNRTRRPSKRAVRDAALIALLETERAGRRFVAGPGARKMWLRLRSHFHSQAEM